MRKTSGSAALQRGGVWRLALALVCACALVSGAAWAQEISSALKPAPRDNEGWMKRHESMNARVAQGNVDLLMIGDSITHGWEGGGKAVWDRYYADRNAVNLGIGGDRTQHVLWRLENGNIEGISPKLAVLMIGTNNHKDNTVTEIADGVAAIVQKLRTDLPETKVLLLGIFPREETPGQWREKLNEVNGIISQLEALPMVDYLDIGDWFLEPDGTLPKAIMPDALHPNEKGYEIWANAMEPKVAEMMGEISPDNPPTGFVSLFNGQNLHGWKGLVENPEKRAEMSPEALKDAQAAADQLMREHWQVKDGVLVFDGHGSHLCTIRDYRDFDLLVDWKIEAEGDSGIYLRGSPQVQIWDPAKWPEGSGGLYNNKQNVSKPLVCADNPIGEWNQFRIRMIGEKVWVYLNDQLVVDEVTLENYWNREQPIYDYGQLELQSHGSTLWFKNVYVQEIPPGEGWQPLFNGEDLTGWEQVGGDKLGWGAEDGVLYTTGVEGAGWLSTAQQYGDFALELEFRVPPGGNSGVFIRAPREGNPAFEGSEVQVLDDYADQYAELKPWQFCGSVYATVAPAKRVTLPAEHWQKMRIRAEGNHVQVWLNCVPIIDADLSEHLDKAKDHPGLKRQEGYIGFQNHGSRLDYRNIRIREL